MDHSVWLDCGEQGSGLREMRPGELKLPYKLHGGGSLRANELF